MSDRIRGRVADFTADPNVLLPKTLFDINTDSLAIGTHTFKRKVRAAGKVSYLSAFADLSTGTITVDLKKNGTSVLVGTQSLTDATTRELEGVGSDATGELRNFNTDTSAHRTALTYTDGDEWSLVLVVATAVALDVVIVVEADEMQPRTGVSDA